MRNDIGTGAGSAINFTGSNRWNNSTSGRIRDGLDQLRAASAGFSSESGFVAGHFFA